MKPGYPTNFQTHKPGFVSAQKPGFNGFSFGCQMAMFECSGVRDRILQLIYSYLQSIHLTSVEAERAFSTAGILCIKIRSRLSDTTLDTLCFLVPTQLLSHALA